MNKKIIAIGVAVLVVLGGIGFALSQSGTPTAKTPAPKVGAATSPDIASPYLQWGGVTHWAASATLRTGSTTLCTLVAPYGTSTLKYASIRLDTSTATAMSLDISKGTASGTPTLFSQGVQYQQTTASSSSRFSGAIGIAVGANATAITMVASSTGLGSALDTFGPAVPLNFNMDNGSGAGQLAPTGYCQAEWVSI